MRIAFAALCFVAASSLACVDSSNQQANTPGTPSRALAKVTEPCGGIAGIMCEPGLRCAPLVWNRTQDPRAPGIADELGRCVPQDAE